MTATGTDVVVIGGGIVGTSAAAFLAEAGATVTLVERDGLASGASGANSGVVQHPFDPILAALYRETVGLYRELTAADVGFRLGAEPAGLIYVSADEAAVRAVDRSLADAFPELERVVAGGAELQAIEPAIAPGLWGCRVGIGYPVAPAASTYAYATIAERRGVRVRAGPDAPPLDRRGDAVVGVVVDGVSTPADAVLVAAGPWSPAVIDPTGAWLPIRERWGVVVETELPTGPTHVLEEAEIGAAIGTGTDRAGRRRTRSSISAWCRSTGSRRSGRPSSRASRIRRTGSSGSSPGRARSSRPSPTRRSAGRARAHGRRAWTAARSSVASRRRPACSSAPATAPGGSRPGRPRPGWSSTRCSAGRRSSRPSSIRAGSGAVSPAPRR